MDACPFSYFLSLFSLCPSFLRPVSLEATHVPLSLNSVVPSHPLTFCSTCSDPLGVLPGTCFPTCDLVHPSEIKHIFPILNPHPTSLPIPSLWVIPVHQPQSSCILHLTWTGDSFLICYDTCFNAIFPNHTPFLSQSPKDCSIHLCLFCCLAYKVVVTIFLNSIYMR